ncbi:uncharacterized protein LOC108197985 [Daucus carota subsp. sativus]|uniref:uncharacterized protein LOC108197985 n=1 Tax=Daucus carota subsp. sativus TaxID=79200 RepID=UPI0030833EF4
MQGIMYDHIQNLDKSRTNWRIKVRCTRFWQTVSNDNNAVKGYNFILLDDDNSHIHAYVYPNNWSAIGKEVVEGNVYVFQNFQVRDSTGKLKPVSTKLCIRLLSSTTIEEQSNDHLIPRYKFEFMDFGDINEESKKVVGDENPEYAIDIIGVIEHFDKMKKIDTRIGKREVTRFVISDGSIPHKVTLWGELAIAVSSDYYKPEIEQPVICILTSAKIGTFMDNVSVGTLPSTRVFFNLDIEPVVEFRNRLIEGGYRPGVGNTNVSNNYAPTLEHVSFADLIANPETMFAKASFMGSTVESLA